MKLGFVSAILDTYSFEEVIDFASEQGFQCVEVACWPQGGVERRYAGVSHIDVANLTDQRIHEIQTYCADKKVQISSLAFYPNPMDANSAKRDEIIDHLKKVIEASHKLGVGMVTTFVGRDQHQTVEENFELFPVIWRPIIELAESLKVKVAIENCPMLFGKDQWPGGQNLGTTPANWRKMFALIDSAYFGLNYDPSHFVWQMVDYVKPLYEFKDKLFHVHFKDIKVYRDKLNEVGVMAYPLEFMAPKLPGLGDVDWGKYVSALTDIGFDGCGCIEVEDKAYEDSDMKRQQSLVLSKRYLEQFVI